VPLKAGRRVDGRWSGKTKSKAHPTDPRCTLHTSPPRPQLEAYNARDLEAFMSVFDENVVVSHWWELESSEAALEVVWCSCSDALHWS